MSSHFKYATLTTRDASQERNKCWPKKGINWGNVIKSNCFKLVFSEDLEVVLKKESFTEPGPPKTGWVVDFGKIHFFWVDFVPKHVDVCVNAWVWRTCDYFLHWKSHEVTSPKRDEVQALESKRFAVWVTSPLKLRSSRKVCAFNGHRAWVSNPRTLVTEREMWDLLRRNKKNTRKNDMCTWNQWMEHVNGQYSTIFSMPKGQKQRSTSKFNMFACLHHILHHPCICITSGIWVR